MKLYQLSLIKRIPNSFKVEEIDNIEGDDLFELVAQFTMLCLRFKQKEIDRLKEINHALLNDDIPF